MVKYKTPLKFIKKNNTNFKITAAIMHAHTKMYINLFYYYYYFSDQYKKQA